MTPNTHHPPWPWQWALAFVWAALLLLVATLHLCGASWLEHLAAHDPHPSHQAHYQHLRELRWTYHLLQSDPPSVLNQAPPSAASGSLTRQILIESGRRGD